MVGRLPAISYHRQSKRRHERSRHESLDYRLRGCGEGRLHCLKQPSRKTNAVNPEPILPRPLGGQQQVDGLVLATGMQGPVITKGKIGGWPCWVVQTAAAVSYRVEFVAGGGRRLLADAIRVIRQAAPIQVAVERKREKAGGRGC
jgi:hypothetical protein